MSFRDFKFPAVVSDLGLTLAQASLFTGVVPHPVTADLRRRLVIGTRMSQGLNNEKARSEFVVAPLLLDLWDMSGGAFGLHSGAELDVDAANGLNGVCDFLLARDPLVYIVRAPVLAIVEAKNDNVWNGYGQCIATMHAVARMNRDAQLDRPVFGASTTGVHWRFFRLDGGVVTIDADDYSLMPDVEKVAGILLSIVLPGAPPTSTAPMEGTTS